MKKAIIVVIIIALLGTIGFLGYKAFFEEGEQPESGDKPTIIEPSNEHDHDDNLAAKVKVEAVNVRNKTDNIDINNVYPTITSFSNKEFENSINKQIANNIAEYRAEINNMVDDATPDVTLYKYVTSYKKYTWGNYLTLVVEQDYQTGGIRSNSWKDIYNVDVSRQRIVELSDLFPATIDFEKEIIDEVTKQSEQRGIKLMGGDGLNKLPTKQKFFIQDGRLFIYFDPSEVAGNIYGALEFEMPFTLNENGYFDV